MAVLFQIIFYAHDINAEKPYRSAWFTPDCVYPVVHNYQRYKDIKLMGLQIDIDPLYVQ